MMKRVQVVDSQPKSKMWYRINATRNMTGGRKIQPNQKMNDKMKEVSWWFISLDRNHQNGR